MKFKTREPQRKSTTQNQFLEKINKIDISVLKLTIWENKRKSEKIRREKERRKQQQQNNTKHRLSEMKG